MDSSREILKLKSYLSVFMLLFCINAQAALNKWVDANGQVHYSDENAPANANSQTLAPPPATSEISGQKSLADQLTDLNRRQDAKKKAEQIESGQRAIAKSDCYNLRTHLSTLEIGGSLFYFDKKGEMVFVDDNDRQKQIETARKRISDKCQ